MGKFTILGWEELKGDKALVMLTILSAADSQLNESTHLHRQSQGRALSHSDISNRTSGTGGFGPGRKLPSHDAALLRAQFKTRQSNLVHNPQMNQARSDSHTKTRKANLQQPGAGLVSYRNKGKSSDAESSSAPPMQGYRNRSGLAPAPNDIILKPMEERCVFCCSEAN